MKKFKPNKSTTFMFAMLETLAPFCIGTPILMLSIGYENFAANEILSVFPSFFYVSAAIIVCCCLFNLATYPFTEYTVFLFDNRLSCGETEVRYDDVTKIELDSGLVRRWGPSEPCYLICYSGDERVISIKHPSLWMSFLLALRCKYAKLRYKRLKKALGMWAFCLVFCLAAALLGGQT